MKTSELCFFSPGVLTSTTDRLPTTDYVAMLDSLKASGVLSLVFASKVIMDAIAPGSTHKGA